MLISITTDSKTKHFILWDRYYNEAEVCDLLKRIGFSDVRISKGLLGDKALIRSLVALVHIDDNAKKL